MTHTEVVNKLIGSISPIGKVIPDKERFENLKAMCSLVDDLVFQIDRVARENKDAPEYSVRLAGQYADKFLTETLGIQ